MASRLIVRLARSAARRTLSAHVAPAARLSLTALACVALAACGPARSGPTYPPAGATPLAATTETAAARDAVIRALSPTGLVVAPTSQPYRPPEGPWFAAAPRDVVELDAPAGEPVASIVLYGFGSSADAATAAADQAAFVARPTSRVFFPSDARFVIRVLGNAAIFFAWSPSASDPHAAAIADALGQVGTGVAVAP